MVEGIFNGTTLQTPLEPDGRFRHWFRVNINLQKAAETTMLALNLKFQRTDAARTRRDRICSLTTLIKFNSVSKDRVCLYSHFMYF